MPNPGSGTPARQEQQLLEESVEKIVVSRERTPRNPRWQRAWWRTLVRFNARLNALHAGDERAADEPADPVQTQKGPPDQP